ncbi:Acyl-coenzyme A thioesterase 9, mitochondrial [Aphelenchoides fujianensis]|nr:Acyl-coenzyme A thioesterase 9, mitochondrial [Aphelenchoides fujianensis]KAI6239362.1 Acyl-coenzyme A thioesterase 9, mitochondrial [Aphelenchoides fujianensis]
MATNSWLTAARFGRALAQQIQPSSSQQLMTIKQINEIIFRHVALQRDVQTIPADPLRAHPPSASASACLIPLASQPEIRLNYVNKFNMTRFGKILEDLDTFAVWLAYKHNQDPAVELGTPTHPPFHAVTACVDKINLQNRVIRADLDILMSGMVTWVGRSSLEITMHLTQKYDEDDYRDILTARFVMVTLEPNGRKSVPNVPLQLETEEDKKWYSKGEHAKNARMAREENSLFRSPPTEIERAIIHDLFLKSMDSKLQSSNEHKFMNDARMENVVVCFPQQRNMYGKIFGGYLMRLAVEQAFANAALFSKSRPSILAVDSVVFQRPVEIGSILLLKSGVSYSTDNFMQLEVGAKVVDIESGDSQTTNTFQFTFKSDKTVPQVVPQSYEDGISYLNARRHFNSSSQAL